MRRHLQLLGHALLSVPYWEWNACKRADEREQYLRSKLSALSRAAGVRGGGRWQRHGAMCRDRARLDAVMLEKDNGMREKDNLKVLLAKDEVIRGKDAEIARLRALAFDSADI